MPCLTRREFINTTTKASGAIAASAVFGRFGSASNSQTVHQSFPDLVMMDALKLSKAIKTKQVSCKEVMATFLEHIERMNFKVNAIVSLQPREMLLKQASERDAQLAHGEYLGWMHGFPHAVKDLAPTKGIRTTWGSALLDTIPCDAPHLAPHGCYQFAAQRLPDWIHQRGAWPSAAGDDVPLLLRNLEQGRNKAGI